MKIERYKTEIKNFIWRLRMVRLKEKLVHEAIVYFSQWGDVVKIYESDSDCIHLFIITNVNSVLRDDNGINWYKITSDFELSFFRGNSCSENGFMLEISPVEIGLEEARCSCHNMKVIWERKTA